MRSRLAGCVALLVAWSAVPVASSEFEGRWRGTLSFRGADWAVGLDLESNAGGWQATLDLPDLVMAGQTVEAQEVDRALRVALPFGIGELDLDRHEGQLRASRVLGESETMQLVLEPDVEVPYSREELRVTSDGATLAASLYRPHGTERPPAVVLVHGSGAGTREQWSYSSWADFYARRGVAALVYDRRGEGGSGGSVDEDRHFELLARDVRALVHALHGRGGIDPDRIGLSGGSQAGWIAALAARGNTQVAWMILRAAPAVSPAEQEMQRVVSTLRAEGAEPSAVQDALAYLRLYFYVAHTGEGWSELQNAIRRAGQASWLEFVDQPQRPEHLVWWLNHHDVDPEPILRDLAIPVLAFYGEADTVVPPEANAELMRRYLGTAGEAPTIVFLPRSDHRLERPMGRDEGGRWDWPRIAPELFAEVDRWLAEIVLR